MSDLEKARNIIDETDREMARLFERRMDAVRQVAEYKRMQGLPIEDIRREEAVLANNTALVGNESYRPYYTRFMQSVMRVSKDLQRDLAEEFYVATSQGRYPVIIRRGGLHCAGELFNLNRKVMVVTDSGVPDDYVMTVASQCGEAIVFVFEQGEASKTMDTYGGILQALVDNGFTRADCVVAVGGGVVGDMAGFAASTYMRGIDFYNVPTTLLAQVDSSIGGKTAVDFYGYKNLVGAFYPPKGVLIDRDVLRTLPKRQIANGVAEMVKMAMTHDAELFSLLETAEGVTDEIIHRALCIKKQVVEADEHEAGLRKVLNFGHTLGHAIESVSECYYHGECVALGMLPMCAPKVRAQLIALYKKWGLPISCCCNLGDVLDACHHDKKVAGDEITVVYVPEIGKYELKTMLFSELEVMIREVMDQ